MAATDQNSTGKYASRIRLNLYLSETFGRVNAAYIVLWRCKGTVIIEYPFNERTDSKFLICYQIWLSS